MISATLQPLAVESVEACIGVAFLCAGVKSAAVESTPSTRVRGLEFAGKIIWSMRTAAAAFESGFRFVHEVDPVFGPAWGDGRAEIGCINAKMLRRKGFGG